MEEGENSFPQKKLKKPYYLIITDDFKSIRNYHFIKQLLDTKQNVGFSLLIVNDGNLSNLPNECDEFINITDKSSTLFEKELNSKSQQVFSINLNPNLRLQECTQVLSNYPIEIDDESNGSMPNIIGFLEMYEVGKVNQLNSLVRWKQNNPILSLQAPVGIGKSGELLTLDAHEKFHGPHGLIAGMTGSGKSEFIITYILSMAVNYHPNEVQFILIDYKGGGLAGAFGGENGIQLPHLAGTITNLDVNEIKRALVSIESELRRRQTVFNEAKEITGESTIDIYKYQKLCREGILKEPVSHLFIICDEFAELKQQQPEFMQQLISTARIGRSLGVHLILATQKPSGVVDNQIWSNTRFRICLRVQEKSDSQEMIKCPDAAFLKQTGRFYLQVGYNEIFTLGQSAWCGIHYVPVDKVRKEVDNSIVFVDNIGYVIKNVDTEKKKNKIASLGEELPNVVKYLSDLADEEHIQVRKLWLPCLSSEIMVEDLVKKYQYQKQNYNIKPVIGEYDNPNHQMQHLLTLPLSEEGNCIVYGMTGSGKESVLSTFLYSCITRYTTSEVNFYILDFGAGILRAFEQAPQVGDIITIDETEKIENLYKMLFKMIEDRKNRFSEYSGDYQMYIKNSGKSVPNIVIIINHFEVYQETYPNYDDELMQLTRDGIKYGIYFILTANNPNGVRSRMSQNFTQRLVLQQNNDSDYISILGNVNKLYPSKIYGRGILKTDDVYEFQIAMIAKKETLYEYTKQVCLQVHQALPVQACKIPILPATVILEELNVPAAIEHTIIGVEKKSLEISFFDFKARFMSIVTGQDVSLGNDFVLALLKELGTYQGTRTLFIDADENEIDNVSILNVQYISEYLGQFYDALERDINDKYNLYLNHQKNNEIFASLQHQIIVILGMDSFRSKVDDSKKSAFGNMFEKAKEIGIYTFIIVDSIDKIKKIELDLWYKALVNANYGIWIGNGIADQYTIKLSKVSRELREEVPNHFCYVIKRGVPILVKYIEK